MKGERGKRSGRGGTSNVQRPTFNVQWGEGTVRVREKADTKFGAKSETKYDLEERLLEFAATIVQLADLLPNTKAENHIAGQLLRCGTSPLANHGEVQAAESRKDFLHKLGICLKELRETKRWLRLIRLLSLVDQANSSAAIAEVEQLLRIFAASIRTTEKNAQ
jgi:four helix bundle protein